MGSLAVAQGTQLPVEGLKQEAQEIAQRCRTLAAHTREARPQSMPFLVKAIENLAMFLSTLNGEPPASGLPGTPPGPNEPHLPTQATASSAGTGFPAV
jgi:hypothetical protein